MSDLSDYAEAALIDHIFNKASLTSLTEFYIAACTAATSDASTGSTITEPSGNGYARAKVYSADMTRSGSTIDNDNDLEFDIATGSWGTITHVALVDAASAGNVIAHKALSTSKAIDTNDVLRFLAGALDFSLD